MPGDTLLQAFATPIFLRKNAGLPEIGSVPAAELAHAFAGVKDPIATAIAVDAKAALAAADETTQWLDNALWIAALHLRAGQTQMAAKVGEAIKGKAVSG